MRSHLLALTLLAVPTAASAIEYLTEISIEAQQAPGMTPDQILSRAAQCLKSTSGNDANEVNASVDGETVYAIVDTEYRFAFSTNTARSRLSVIARDERFKVMHTDIDNGAVNPLTVKRLAVPKQLGGPASAIEAALVERSAAVAECIVKKPEVAGGDW